ncbi:MAG TPA: hypothetical protein VD839_06610, partial [Burkholderiales bacterium]|nr:hypothetical protein [Burkholderiales bacterium]
GSTTQTRYQRSAMAMVAKTEEFRVMTSGAFTAAHLELIPQLERLTKKRSSRPRLPSGPARIRYRTA